MSSSVTSSIEFETVIGLEVHVQLATDTKIFCGCRVARLPSGGQAAIEVGVNMYTCPVCSAQPGALPVLNEKVLDFAVRAGLATHCKIRTDSVFSRKNYFYPDLPKGYQISQFDKPICEKGYLDVPMKGGASKRFGITRIHIEEDAGKNVHMESFSLVNLNRAGVPLLEVVSEPEMRTPEEAGAYLRTLYSVVTYLGICDGNLQEGNFRCDANVSVRPKGAEKFGTRTETKNVNSFRFVEKAIEYETARQIEVIRAGGKIVQETRLYDSDKGVTISMRSKEEAHDYRYFPEPDLIPLKFETLFIEKVRESLPELPEEKKLRYVEKLGLSAYDAGVVTGSKAMAGFFEKVLEILSGRGKDAAAIAKTVANLLTGEVARLCNDEEKEISESKLVPEHLADVVGFVADSVVSSTGAKQVIAEIWKSGEKADAAVERLGLKQVSDTSALEPAVDRIIAANPGQVAEFRSGKEKLLGFFVGQAMKETGGKANPGLLKDIVLKKLKG